MENQLNVLDTQLQLCCSHTSLTQKRFGYVPTYDARNQSICAIMTDEFLQFPKAQGNDLISHNPMYNFAGLKAGDK